MKRQPRSIGPADLDDQERYDGAQWFYYKFLSKAEIAGIPRMPFIEPEEGDI